MTRWESSEDLGALRSVPIFEGVSQDAVNELTSFARCHDYPKNNILFYAGDPSSHVFLVLSGCVKVTLMNEEGREVILTIVREGGFFGIVAAIDQGPHPANAVTVEPSRLVKFDGECFMKWIEAQPPVQLAVMRDLSRRVRGLYSKIGEHALMAVKERLLLALLEIADREGEVGPGGEIVFTRPTHQELANRIGSSREVVSRVLKELLDSEMLRAEGRVIRVPESALVLRED